MAEYPPFMNAYGLVPKILEKIKQAKTPTRFTQDFLGRNLGFPSGSAKPFIPLAKRLGLLSSDGTPSEIYHRLRNPNHSKGAMAEAIHKGYAQLYDRNEFAHDLDKQALEGLVVQATGIDRGSPTLRAIVNTFEALKPFADFECEWPSRSEDRAARGAEQGEESEDKGSGREQLKMNMSYTINLNLPKSDDIAVFNAIFKALRENLLKQ